MATRTTMPGSLDAVSFFSHGVSERARMFLEINLADKMETATIEQIHRIKQLQLKQVALPAIRRLSREQRLNQSCAFKEFRFEPPYAGKKGNRRKKKLPPIPENMLPKRHNSFEEDLEDTLEEPIPELTISPAFITEKPEERSISVEDTMKSSSHRPTFNSREFTFPVSSAKRNKLCQVQGPDPPSPTNIVPALTPRNRDIPLQAKIEKLAKQKRKERAKREKRYERQQHTMDFKPDKPLKAFKSKREPESHNVFQLKEHKQSPFKQMFHPPDEAEKAKIHPRLYTRIVDSIYSYSKGTHNPDARQYEDSGNYERLMVTPVTVKDDLRDDLRQLTFLPPIV